MDQQLLKYGFRGSLARLRRVVAALSAEEIWSISDLDCCPDVLQIPSLAGFLLEGEAEIINSIAALVTSQAAAKQSSAKSVVAPVGHRFLI
jgi:hypothetical protein